MFSFMSIILYACIFRQSFFRGLQVAGLLIKKELAAFSMVLTSPQKPLLAIVGGAKISDKIKSRRAAAGRAELLAKKRHTDRLQNLAKLRRFWIRGGIRAG